MVDQNGVVGKLGMNGFGEVVISYFPKTNILGVYMTHSYSGFGSINGAELNVADTQLTWTTGASPFWNYQELDSSWTDTEKLAFIDGINSGDSWFQISSELYPNGLARANLDNYLDFGTSALTFTAELNGDNVDPDGVTTTSVGSASISFSSDTNEITISAKVKLTDKTDAITGYNFVNTLDGSQVIFYDTDVTKIGEIAVFNSISYSLLKSGYVQLIVTSNTYPNGLIAGTFSS